MKRIFSFILSLLIIVFSYPFSFLPTSYDKEFTMENAITEFEVTEDQNKTEYLMNEKTDLFNYYGIDYTSDGYCRGHIVFETYKGETAEEDFFLEPGENATFYSFIDGFFDKEKNKSVKTVSVENITGESFVLHGIKTFNRKVEKREVFISDEYYKLGIDLQWGGALSYLEDLKNDVESVKVDGIIKVDSNASERYNKRAISRHVNLINRYDAGRLVQQSYYGPMDIEGYPNGTFTDGNKWNYNPVQGGNKYNGCSKIVDIRKDGNTLYVKCRPMDWAMPDEWITPSYMEAWYSLGGGRVHASCRYTDWSGYPTCRMGVELPAFYCIEPLNRFVYYGGDKPWTGDTPDVEPSLDFWPISYPHFRSTENWAAFTGQFDDSFGIALYSPLKDIDFLSGVYGRNETIDKDASKDCATSYFAVTQTANEWQFESYKPYEYDFYLTTGTVEEIRANFKEIK